MERTVITNFLEAHGFYRDLDLSALAQSVRNDMIARFLGKKSDQDMICTFIDPSSIEISEKSVIVIDAGGTNFRSSLVTFSKDGSYSVSGFEKTKMPGVEKELSKKEFFDAISANISRFKDTASEICFCFSYAMTITEEKDGVLISFAKEVKAPEVVGCHIGAELKKSLKENGWTKIPEVILLNDTASALLAGSGSKKYSSFIGFILGTGLNAAYLQPANKEYELKKQIVVCESAKFSGFKNSDFDIFLDEKSVKPGSAPFEKLCSGAYVGPLALETLQFAAKEKIFSEEFSDAVLNRKSLTLIEVSGFLENSNPEKCEFSDLFDSDGATDADLKNIFEIFDALVNRMAQLSAVIIAACLVQCEEGKNSSNPVFVSCNGSSFFKSYRVYERTKQYLDEILEKLPQKIYYELSSEEADITRGTAMAAFV
ncbi:MAG: hexokinase [Treponema sp.]|nr:hexokinase [Treponema sp.]